MNWLLKQALRDVIRQAERGNVLRTDEEATRAAAVAREARGLLLHDSDNVTVETWFTDLEQNGGQAAVTGRSTK